MRALDQEQVDARRRDQEKENRLYKIEQRERRLLAQSQLLTARLLTWLFEVSAAFRFNPSVGVPEQEKREVEIRNYQQRQPVEVQLRCGERELTEITRRAQAQFQAYL